MFKHFLEPLQEDDFRRSPHPGMTPILWYLWHIARVEDIGITRFVVDAPQLFDEDWALKMKIPQKHYGTSMTDEEVQELARQASVKGVLDYYQAVGQQTEKLLDEVSPETLDEKLDEQRVRKLIVKEEIGGPRTEWVIPNYIGKTKAWCLTHFCLTHGFYHLGQAYLVRKMLGHRPMGD
jgi:uncharacterized damage-inducible protein DinB